MSFALVSMKNEIIHPRFDDRILLPEDGEDVLPIYTLPLHEFRFQEFCRKNGIVNYLPLKQAWKIANYTKNGKQYHYQRKVLRPMFASYVFVRMANLRQHDLFLSGSVNRVLPVADKEKFLGELRLVRQVELIGFSEELEFNCGMKEGDHFEILSGPWQGVCGWLKQKDKLYLWTVEIEFVNEVIRAKIDPSKIKMRRLEE